MIEFLRNWVTNIVMLIIFIAMLEIILPNNNMKRYINMIIGLLIIIVIINPFISLLTKDISIEREVFKNILKSNEIRSENKEDLKETQDNQVIEIYKASLEEELYKIISTKIKYEIINIEINIVEDKNSDEFGMVKNVFMTFSRDKLQNGSNEEITINEIEEVSVNLGDKKEIVNGEEDLSGEFNEIKDILSDYYKIPKNNIIILKNS